jgi:hypothetical protein
MWRAGKPSVVFVLAALVALASTAAGHAAEIAVGIARVAPGAPLDSGTDRPTAAATDFTVRPSVVTSSLGAGEQTLDLVVFCFDIFTGAILPNCDVEMSLDAVPFSGGHHHHDASRPAGELDPASGNTGADGFLETTYTAPEVSGVVIATVTGVTQDGFPVLPGAASIGVRISGLVGLAVTGTGYTVQASDDHANDNRFATPAARDDLASIPVDFREELTDQGVAAGDLPTLIYTSICLIEGGLFDVGSTFWKPPHTSHRFGTDADLFTSNDNFTSVPDQYLDELETVILNNTSFYFPVRDESPDGTASHWHLRVQ